jgi:hypothetical protein
MKKLAFVLFLFLALPASAIKLAVLEIISSDEEFELAIHETRFLTDELRRRMIYNLPQDYSIFTREQILSLIPSDAEDLSTAISIGRAIKSDFVTHGYVGRLGDSYVLTIELFECNNGLLIGDIVKTAPNLEGLMELIGENTPRLAKIIAERGDEIKKAEMERLEEEERLRNEEIARLNEEIDLQIAKDRAAKGATTEIQEKESIIANMVLAEKLNTPALVAVSLDLLGIAALGFGIYQSSKANDLYKKSEGLIDDAYKMNLSDYDNKRKEFENKRSDMESAETLRSFGLIAGSLLLASGIAIHIWF